MFYMIARNAGIITFNYTVQVCVASLLKGSLSHATQCPFTMLYDSHYEWEQTKKEKREKMKNVLSLLSIHCVDAAHCAQ